jgi:hypothetical protein
MRCEGWKGAGPKPSACVNWHNLFSFLRNGQTNAGLIPRGQGREDKASGAVEVVDHQ